MKTLICQVWMMCLPLVPPCRVSPPEPHELSGEKHSIISRRKENESVQTKIWNQKHMFTLTVLLTAKSRDSLSPFLTSSGYMSPCWPPYTWPLAHSLFLGSYQLSEIKARVCPVATIASVTLPGHTDFITPKALCPPSISYDGSHSCGDTFPTSMIVN